MLDFDFLSKRNPRPNMPPYLNKQQPFILEIENETRKYVLAAKSLFDLQEWYKAIYAHIETLSDNKNILKNHLLMTSKEKDISKRDQDLIYKIFGKLKLEIKHPSAFNQFMLLSNHALQARLIDFVQDAFIAELLVGITKYMVLCE
jgi:hypothetical protein